MEKIRPNHDKDLSIRRINAEEVFSIKTNPEESYDPGKLQERSKFGRDPIKRSLEEDLLYYNKSKPRGDPRN